MKLPAYSWGDKVEFLFNGTGEPLQGFIEIVDAHGTFFQREEPSYDICVPEKNNCLYKHVPESDIRRKLIKEPVTRGILQYYPSNDMYAVQYSRDGYAVPLDNPSFTEIRLTGTREWISVAFVYKEMPAALKEDWMNVSIASLKEWIGKSVEIRYMPPYMMVCDLIHTHQDDSYMIYEVYREDANVVLYDGGFVMWNPEQMILRGAKHHVSAEYYNERVFRWDVVNGIMRICLGPVADPKPETVENAEEYLKMIREMKERD